jgi:hypothetical protein
MTIQEFADLDETGKLSAILEYGRLLAQNLEDSTRTFLYRFDDFYVSAIYATKDDELKEIRSFIDVVSGDREVRRIFTLNPAERPLQK